MFIRPVAPVIGTVPSKWRSPSLKTLPTVTAFALRGVMR